jgi:flagellar basal-body rod modification protein FlgD
MSVNGIDGSSGIQGTGGTQGTYLDSQVLGKDDFLELLTTKLRYQDPMNPEDDQEFVAQLAQFSSLEQMENMNMAIQTQLVLTQSTNNALATGMIGRNVVAVGNEIHLEEDGSSEIMFNLESDADVTVQIKDSDGSVVKTISAGLLSSGDETITWDGTDNTGNSVAAGSYTYEVTASASDGSTVDATTYTTGLVSGVEFMNGSAFLKVDGMDVSLANVVRVEDV